MVSSWPKQEMHHQGIGAQVEGIAGVDQRDVFDVFRRQDEIFAAKGVGPVAA